MRVQKLSFIAAHEISGRSQKSQLLTHDLRGTEKPVDAQTEAERSRRIVLPGHRQRPDFGRLEKHVQFEDVCHFVIRFYWGFPQLSGNAIKPRNRARASHGDSESARDSPSCAGTWPSLERS
jgi:hypothetical protein